MTWIPGDDFEAESGLLVRARRFVTPWLHVANTHDRQPDGEWAGITDGDTGMQILGDQDEFSGQYLDFGYVFLGGDPNGGTARLPDNRSGGPR